MSTRKRCTCTGQNLCKYHQGQEMDRRWREHLAQQKPPPLQHQQARAQKAEKRGAALARRPRGAPPLRLRGSTRPWRELPPPPLLPPWPGLVTTLGLSNRATNALLREGITTVTQLSALDDLDLLDIRNFGWGCLVEVRGKVPAPGTMAPLPAPQQASVLMAVALAALAELARLYPQEKA